MSRPRRHSKGGMVFHVLNRGVGRRVLFTKDEDFLAFERVVEETLRTRRMRLCAYFLMPNHWHFVVWPERDGDVPAFMQQVTNTHVKRWKEHRHEIGYGHLYQGRYKCFPVETEQKTTSTRSFATWSGKPCVQTRGASGIVALVEFAPSGARRPGVPHPLGVAFASPHRRAPTCQPAANGSRSGGVAVLRQSRSALRRSQLGHRHGRAIGAGMDDSASRKTEETITRLATVTCVLQIWWLSPFTTLELGMVSPELMSPELTRFVSFAWRYHWCDRGSSPIGSGRGTVDQPGVGSRYLQPACSVGTAGSPKFPEEPL